MTEHLSPLDAAFLELEEADEAAHMHIGWALVFDPAPGGEPPEASAVRDRLEERLDALPRFRRRLSSPRVGRLTLPTWDPDPDFDLAAHIRRATLPAPGGEAELLDWLGDFYSHRLDRSRPLWEMTLLDGLEGGRWALASKAHHCLVDGISGVGVATALLDPEPSPPARPTAPASSQAEDEEVRPGRSALSRVMSAAEGAAGALDPRRLPAMLSRSRSIAEILRDELVGAPRTSLNQRIGGTRRLALARAPLEDLKRVKNVLGGTVNDVILAVTAGGLRRLFETRGEIGEVAFVRAMVPVSVRAASESLALGNRVSSLFVELPVGEPQTLLRYRKTVAAAEDLKSGGQAAGGESLLDLAGMTPPLVQGAIARLAFTPRLFNITITNVPGPQSTFYAMGAPLRQVVPLVPIFTGHAVGVAAVSYDGEVSFGLNGDRATVPDLDVLRTGIEQSIAELLELAQRGADLARDGR